MKITLISNPISCLLPVSAICYSLAIICSALQFYSLQNSFQIIGIVIFFLFASLRYRSFQPEFLFVVFFLAYSYAYGFPNFILESVRNLAYTTNDINLEPLAVNYLVSILYILFFLFLARDKKQKKIFVPRMPSSLLQNSIVLALIIIFVAVLSLLWSQIQIDSYFASNKLDRNDILPSFFDYVVFTVVAFVILISFEKVSWQLKLILAILIALSFSFHVVSGQRELLVALPIAFLLTKTPFLSFVKSAVLGISLLAFLSYLKMVYPYIGYLFIGKNAVFTVDLEKYLFSIFFNEELTANLILFNKFVDVNAVVDQWRFFWHYCASFFPFSQTFFSLSMPSAGEQLMQHLNIAWGGLASHPHIYPFATLGFVGVFLSTLFILANFLFLRALYYKPRFWCVKVFANTTLSFFVVLVNRNELNYVFKHYVSVIFVSFLIMILSFVLISVIRFFVTLRRMETSR